MAFVQMRDDARVTRFERLKKRSDFVAAASGRRFHTERMTVQGLRRDDSDGLRIGLTVTKRVGHATERTRIKRRLREATRLAVARRATERESANGAPCDDAADQLAADIVVIARRPVLSAEFDVLIEDFVRALQSVTKPGQPKARSGQGSKQAGASHPRRGRATQPSHSS
ncbi:MAG TPA: ribonuclease P protein component [Saliniramus sp.]|nr:ribonuclease P protein component [Saliniramus sp.]